MLAAQTIAEIRRRSGLGLRELARRSRTSHATLHAYERGLKAPRLDTIERIAAAAGFTLSVELQRRPDADRGAVAKGRELADALELADQFPTCHKRELDAPVFGRPSA